MNTEIKDEIIQNLTFKLDDELYAFNISSVQSVLDFEKITKVPQTPNFMRGVINLRGSVVPVIDLRLKFGMTMTEKTVNSCIIIVEVNMDDDVIVLGCLADSVKEVIDIGPDAIEPAPKIGTRLKTEFIKGIGRQNEEFIIILDLDKIFSSSELKLVQETGSNENENIEEKVEEKNN